jgi:hypothetical protein
MPKERIVAKMEGQDESSALLVKAAFTGALHIFKDEIQ